MNFLLSIIISLFLFAHSSKGDDIIGTYWTEDHTGKIEIYKCRDHYCGKIQWREEARQDVKNPDPDLRNRSVIGLKFMQGFTYDERKNLWTGGTVYSIDNGGTYQGKMWLEKNGAVLKMRGYIGISLIGRTASLQRVQP